MTAEVRSHLGAPTLFVDGKPHTGLMFWHSRPFDADEDYRRFAQAGVNLISAGFSTGVTANGTYDHSDTDAKIAAITEANPRALILPRLSLSPADWWLEANPGERMVHINPLDGTEMPEGGARVSFASGVWRRDAANALSRFITYCESRYEDRILGYQIAAGQFGEWSYSWEGALSDYSEPQRKAFSRWLEGHYAGDLGRLRASWNDEDISFETVSIPRDRTRAPYQSSLLDPACERRIIDYLQFHSRIVEETILFFCSQARESLDAVGHRKLLAVFYGYLFWDVGIPSNMHNSGHHSCARLLESRNVDVLCAPYSYLERHPGGIHVSQIVSGSVRLHNKLFYTEDDTRTFLAPVKAAYGRCPDLDATVGVLRRNLLGSIGAGGTHWWMDLYGGGWYRDDRLMNAVADLRRLSETMINHDRTPSCQTAVIVSKESFRYFRQDESLSDALIGRQISEIAHSGFPFDTYFAEDLPLLLSREWSSCYRLFLFLNTLYLSPAVRDAIETGLKKDNRTLVWIHGAGLVGESALEPEGVRELTGFTIRMGDPLFGEVTYPLMVETNVNGSRVVYGAGQRIGPVLYGDDASAETLGLLIHPNLPGLLRRDHGGWRSIWSAAPNLPSVLLREIARRAGVHVYTDSGDQVQAGAGVIAIHAAGSGQRQIRLPSRSDIFDAVSGEPVAENTDSVTVSLQRGETALWTTTPIPGRRKSAT